MLKNPRKLSGYWESLFHNLHERQGEHKAVTNVCFTLTKTSSNSSGEHKKCIFPWFSRLDVVCTSWDKKVPLVQLLLIFMQLPYSEVQHWGKPDFYFQLQNMRQKGRHTQSLARTHGRISDALLLNLALNKGSHQNQDLFEDLENFLLGLMKNRALHELFSQAEHRAQVRLLTC